MKEVCYFLFIATIFIGCKETTKSNILIPKNDIDVSLTIDTIFIDSGEDFIYLGRQLSLSDLSSDMRYLYNFNPINYEIEVIDLDRAELVEKYKIEKEGPQAVPNHFLYRMSLAEDLNELFFQSTSHIYNADINGKVKSNYSFLNDSLSDIRFNPENLISLQGHITEDGNYYYSLYTDTLPNRKRKGLIRFEFKSKEIEFRELDFLKWANDFDIFYREPGRKINKGEYLEMIGVSFKGDSIILSTGSVNKIWVYHFDSNSSEEISFESQLTKNQKEGNFPKMVESMDGFLEAVKKKNLEVNFRPLKYDSENQIFLRITIQFEGYDIHGEPSFNTYLTVFDQNLKALNESIIPKPGFFPSSSKSFIKDGYYWTFLNLEDELAFVRLKPTISYE